MLSIQLTEQVHGLMEEYLSLFQSVKKEKEYCDGLFTMYQQVADFSYAVYFSTDMEDGLDVHLTVCNRFTHQIDEETMKFRKMGDVQTGRIVMEGLFDSLLNSI